MRRWLCWLCLLSWAWAQPNYQYQGLSIKLPAQWTAQAVDDSDSSLLAVVQSPRQSLVLVRHYASNPGASLEDIFTQLKYNIIIKQEGRVLDKAYLSLGRLPAMRVRYWGRASSGPMKYFTRYFFLDQGQLVYVHCVSSGRDAAEEAQFENLATSLIYQQPLEAEPEN